MQDKQTVPKRFYLFEYDNNCSAGGFDDLTKGSFLSADDAKRAATGGLYYAEVVTINEAGQMVLVSAKRKGPWRDA